MSKVIVYIGLGSNLDVPERQVKRACRALAQLAKSKLIRSSSLYRSQPLVVDDQVEEWDATMPAQPDYINAVVALETGLPALQLLDLLQAIEVKQGRNKQGPRWGPRPLDLDILLYGHNIISDLRLTVPHPGLAEREFVLYPLYQIAPQLVFPDGIRLKDQVARCPLRGLQRLQESALDVV